MSLDAQLTELILKTIKVLGRIPKEVDIFLGTVLTHHVFGGFDVNRARTISSMIGEEQAMVLYKCWDGRQKSFYPWVPLHHPFSQLAIDICEAIQKYHGLVSIEWRKVEKVAERDYPGIRAKVEKYLKLQGVE